MNEVMNEWIWVQVQRVDLKLFLNWVCVLSRCTKVCIVLPSPLGVFDGLSFSTTK